MDWKNEITQGKVLSRIQGKGPNPREYDYLKDKPPQKRPQRTERISETTWRISKESSNDTNWSFRLRSEKGVTK